MTIQPIYDRDPTEGLPDGDLDSKLALVAALLKGNDNDSYPSEGITVAEAEAVADIDHLLRWGFLHLHLEGRVR